MVEMKLGTIEDTPPSPVFKKKELLVSTLAGLNERIDNHPAGCGSNK